MNVLLVDGYNIIGDWDELKPLRDKDLDQARKKLIDYMGEYQSYRGYRVIIVFDAYEVKGLGAKEIFSNVEVIYTKEKETADECIERLVKAIKNVRTKVYVATSDYQEQRTIFQQGAYRKSARELQIELKHIQGEIEADVKHYKREGKKRHSIIDEDTLAKLEKLRRGRRD